MRRLSLFIAIYCISQVAFAQAGLHAGINAAFNNVWILNQNNYGITEMDYDLKFGALAGLEGGYNFTQNFGAEVELNYVMMGQNYYDRIRDFGPIDSASGKAEKVDTYRYVKLNYLQLPILFRYQTTKEKKDKIEFHAMLGPAFGILLSADQYYEADIDGNTTVELLDPAFVPEHNVSEFASTPEIEEPKSYFSTLDIGLHADFGVDIYISDELYLTPALKLYAGFTDVNSEPTRQDPVPLTTANEYEPSRNGYAGISLGIHYIKIEKKKK